MSVLWIVVVAPPIQIGKPLAGGEAYTRLLTPPSSHGQRLRAGLLDDE